MDRIKNIFKNNDIWMTILATLLLGSIIIPFIYLSRYTWPAVDDFMFSSVTKHAWLESGNIFTTIGAAIEKTKSIFMDWQGTYSAIFLMALQPGIWGDQLYFIGPLFIILGFLFGIFYFTNTIMINFLHSSKRVWFVITSFILAIYLLYMMHPEEGFFWWNGASYYTGFYSWSLVYLSILLRILLNFTTYSKFKKYLSVILMCCYGLFLAGGNYATVLLLSEVLFLLSIYMLINKKIQWKICFLQFSVVMGGFLISILAPGNQNHVSSDVDLGMLETIFISISEGLFDIKKWFNIVVILLFLLLIPYFIRMVKNVNTRFKYPLLFTIISAGMYLSLYAPIVYSFGGNFAPGRMINLFYLNFYILIAVNTYYWTGYIVKKFFNKTNINGYLESIYLLLIGICMVAGIYYINIYNLNITIFARELYSNRYSQIYESYLDRAEILEQSNQQTDVIFSPLPYHSELLFFGDLYEDEHTYDNTCAANYYNIKSIKVKKE